MFRRLSSAQLTVDVGLAVACLLVRWTISEFLPIWFVVFAMAAALAIRRLSPGLALGIAWAGALAQMIGQVPPDISNTAILAVLFATARYGGRTLRWLGLVSAVVGAAVATSYMILLPKYGFGVDTPGAGPRVVILTVVSFGSAVALLGLSWTLGLLARTWANARESRRQQRLAEHTVVIEQERNRIARDMHDVVAHSLAVVIAQADGARYAGDKASADAALSAISTTARDALADVRLLLGQLRHNEEAGPQPALADLEPLFGQLRASGLHLDVQTSGEPLTLPSGQQLALYRIVQEALTNALRHGDTDKPVVVALDWTADAATATISSALRTPAAAGQDAGHGIAGMRERAALVGGTLSAAPDGESFVVRARIPIRAEVGA